MYYSRVWDFGPVPMELRHQAGVGPRAVSLGRLRRESNVTDSSHRRLYSAGQASVWYFGAVVGLTVVTSKRIGGKSDAGEFV